MNDVIPQQHAGLDLNVLYIAMIQRGLMYSKFAIYPPTAQQGKHDGGSMGSSLSFTLRFSERAWSSQAGTVVHITRAPCQPHLTVNISFTASARYARTHVEDHMVACFESGAVNAVALLDLICKRLDINMLHHPSQYPDQIDSDGLASVLAFPK